MRWVLPVVLVLAGCTPAVRPVTPAVVASAGARGVPADAARLEAGRATYVRACGSCHQLYPTDAYDGPGWIESVRTMAPKAKLTPDQAALVRDYLLAAHHVVE